MKHAQEAQAVIRELAENGFYAVCPCCGEPVLLKHAGLFYLDDFTPEAEDLYRQKLEAIKARRAEIREQRQGISRSSEVGAAAVNIGFILERIAPSLKDFRFNQNDCRALFDPIDYLIFEGMSSKGAVSKILFVDIKTGSAKLTAKQKEIRSLVERKKIVWDTYETER